MKKNATTDYPIHSLIRRRWSPRAFADRAVEQGKLVQILEAARWSPSWRNDQPWRFIVATKADPKEYRRLFDCLKPGNQRWAGTAPVLMLVAAKRGYDHSPQANPMTLYDAGQAVAQLTIEAIAQGLYVHQMGGIHQERIRDSYGMPPEFQPVVAMAIGYLGQPTDLPPDLHKKEVAPRNRLSLQEIAFSSVWGLPFIVEGELSLKARKNGKSVNLPIGGRSDGPARK